MYAKIPLLSSVLAVLCLLPQHALAQIHAPVQFMTRAETVRILLLASEEEVPVRLSRGIYPDVLDNQWYTKYVMFGIEKGLLDAEPETGLLFPHRSISRAEFLKMMTTAFGLETYFPHFYTDVAGLAWYAPYAGLAWQYQLFSDEGDELKPERRMTQNEASTALNAFFVAHPDRQPTNPIFYGTLTRSAQPIEILSTPELVKESILRLLQIPTRIHPDITKAEVIERVNAERVKFDLEPLSENQLLEYSAQEHARDMYKRGYFSHTTPEGLTYVDRIRASDYLTIDQEACGCHSVFNVRALMERARTETTPTSVTTSLEVCGCDPKFSVGENIAKGQLSAKQVIDQWLNSPGHRRNILSPQFEEVGIGLFGNIWVQNFGRLVAN